MKVLITGSGGYIGTRLREYVKDAYYDDEIFLADTKTGIDYATIEGREFDVVFHLGAISTIMDSFARADEMMQVNALNLIPFLMRNKIGKLVFTSTGAIYGDHCDHKKEEEAKWMDCLCPYAQTKYVAEGIIRKLHPNHVICRLGNVFGGDYSPRGEMLSIPHFMQDNPIVVYGGEQVRDFVHIDVVCWAMVEASLRHNFTGTFNIARGQGVRLKAIAEMFAEKRQVPIEYHPHREGDAKYVVLDVSKARAARLLHDEGMNDYCR